MKNSSRIAIDKAQVLEDNEEYQKAYDVLKKAYESDDSSAELLEKLALAAHILHLDNEAVEYWEKLMELDPNSEVCYSQLIDLYLHSNKHKYYLTRAKLKVIEQNPIQASSDLKKAIDNTNDPDELLFARKMLAELHKALNKTHNAIDEYLRILDIEPNVEIFSELADLYALTNKYDAVDVLRRALADFEDDPVLSEKLSNLAISIGDFELGLKHATNDFLKAKALLLLENNEEAFRILSALQGGEKHSIDAVSLFAQYYYNIKDFDKCLGCVDELSKLQPGSPLVYQMRALTYEALDDTLSAHKNWGRYYLTRSNLELALNDFMQAHQQAPEDAEVVSEIIKIVESQNDKHMANEFYEKLVRLEPKNKKALQKSAEFYGEIGDYHQALEFLERLVEIDKSNIDAIHLLAGTYEKLKDKEQALACYEKYLKLAPLSPFSDAVKVKVERLKSQNFSDDEGFLEKILGFFNRK